MTKVTKIGNISIKPAKNGFLIVCDVIDESADPAHADPFSNSSYNHRQDIYVHQSVSDVLVTIDTLLRTPD